MSEHESDEERPTEFQIQVPNDLEAGVYANFLSVWHTAYEFTLDFGVTQPPQVDADDPDGPVRVECRVVSRVKIPVTVLCDVLRALKTEGSLKSVGHRLASFEERQRVVAKDEWDAREARYRV